MPARSCQMLASMLLSALEASGLIGLAFTSKPVILEAPNVSLGMYILGILVFIHALLIWQLFRSRSGVALYAAYSLALSAALLALGLLALRHARPLDRVQLSLQLQNLSTAQIQALERAYDCEIASTCPQRIASDMEAQMRWQGTAAVGVAGLLFLLSGIHVVAFAHWDRDRNRDNRPEFEPMAL